MMSPADDLPSRVQNETHSSELSINAYEPVLCVNTGTGSLAMQVYEKFGIVNRLVGTDDN
jgi:fatty acid-binding protein DegV